MGKFIFMDPSKPAAVWWPVTISVPVDSKDADKPMHVDQTANLRLCVISDQAYHDTLYAGGQLEILKKVVLDWDFIDDQGKPVPFERFPEIAAVPYVGDGMIRSYRAFIGRAAEKN